MGYEIHITRKAEWFDEDGPEITLREWLDYVESDSEMRADGHAETKTPGGVLRIEHEGIAAWTAHPDQAEGGVVWFSHFRDRVTVKNPDRSVLIKMYRIASQLGARVQGDEGEEYDLRGRPIDEAPRPPVRKTAWGKFW